LVLEAISKPIPTGVNVREYFAINPGYMSMPLGSRNKMRADFTVARTMNTWREILSVVSAVKGVELRRRNRAKDMLLFRGEHLHVRVVGKGGLQVLTAECQGLRAVAVGEEPEVADSDAAWGQDARASS
jgi:hypothetical protein